MAAARHGSVSLASGVELDPSPESSDSEGRLKAQVLVVAVERESYLPESVVAIGVRGRYSSCRERDDHDDSTERCES